MFLKLKARSCLNYTRTLEKCRVPYDDLDGVLPFHEPCPACRDPLV